MPFNYEAPRRFSVPFTYTIEDVLAMDPSGGRPKEGGHCKDDFDPYTIAVFLHYIEGREE